MGFFKTSRIACLFTLSFFISFSTCHASETYIKSEIQDYAKSTIDDEHLMSNNNDMTLSVSNNSKELDKSEILGFANAFLWASSTRTEISISEISRLNIVYLHNSSWTVDSKIDNTDFKFIFEQNLESIKNNRPCSRVDLSNRAGRKITIVYLDANEEHDIRLSCVYRHFRSLYGISEKYQMPDFGSTFVADPRMIRCKHKYPGIDIAQALYSGKC